MKTLTLLFLVSISAFADIPKDDDLLSCNWNKAECRPVGKLIVKGPTKGLTIAECTAFLSSRNTITTAGHCLTYGIKNAKFCLHSTGDKDPKCSAEVELEGMWTSGGGIKKEEELKGWDWAHATLKEPLGEQLVNGKKVGWLELTNDSDDLAEGSDVTVVSYLGDWFEGEYASFQRAKIHKPPKFMLGKCNSLTPKVRKKADEPEDDEELECNFLHLRDYRYSTKGMDSGAPVIGKSGKVVGILVGRTTKQNQGYPWAATVNEARDASANALLHLEQLKLYHKLDQIVALLKERSIAFPKDDKDAWDRVKHLDTVLAKWAGDKEPAERFERVQKWDLLDGIKYVSDVIDELRTRNRAQPDGNGLFISLPESSAKVHDGTKKFGQFYDSGVATTEAKYVAARAVDASTKEAEVVELKKKRKEIEKDIKGGTVIGPP